MREIVERLYRSGTPTTEKETDETLVSQPVFFRFNLSLTLPRLFVLLISFAHRV